ncbi:MAG: hypothetical protein E6K31_16370, partial [Gammaproteobacteria bacterium]
MLMKRGKSTIPVDEDWETGDEIDLRHYWSVINRRKWSIIGLALAVGLLTTLVVFAMTPIYRASATLLIESQAPNVVSIQEVYGLDTRSQDYLATQIEIMGGRPIAETVVDGLGLIEQPELRPEHPRPLIDLDWPPWLPFGMQQRASTSQPNERERAVDAYLDKLRIEPVRMTQLVRVQFDSADPKLAASVAEAHAKAYIDSTLEARADATRSATEWMATRVESLRKELQASEASLQAYREQEQIVDASGLKALPAAEISNLSSRLLEVRQTLAAAKIAYLQVTPVDGRGENLLGVPALLADEGMRRAQAAQATAQQAVAELEKRYGASHPKMVAAQNELAQATENLNNQARSVIEGIRKRYEAAKSEEAAIVAALSRAGQQYQQVGREHAVVPRLPAKPSKRRIVSSVVVLTLLFGVGVAFLLASLDNTVKSSRDVEEKLKRPLLGIEPLLGNEALRAVSTLGKSDETRETDPRFAEAMRTIRTAISLDSLDKPHKIILVTSSIGSEGKSIFALNLAVAFARGERTLLLDGDLRRPSVGKILGLPRDALGLSELLTNRAQLSECVIGTGVKDLHAISTGFIPPDPLHILSSSRMASALKVLAHSFSRIVIDCAP